MALYAGIDLHSNNSVVVLLNEQDQVVSQQVEKAVCTRLKHTPAYEHLLSVNGIRFPPPSLFGFARNFLIIIEVTGFFFWGLLPPGAQHGMRPSPQGISS